MGERSEQAAWCERQRAPEVSGEERAAPAYHRVPFPNGPTNGDNLGPLCRRHHNFKSHGILRWSTTPPKPPPPPIVIEIYRDTIPMEYVP